MPKENPEKYARTLEKDAEDFKAGIQEEKYDNLRNPLQMFDSAAPVLQSMRQKPRDIQQELLRNTQLLNRAEEISKKSFNQNKK